MDKKLLKETRDSFTLHTMLLVRDGKSKAVAQALAYHEGKSGLDRRLGQQSLIPLLETAATSPAPGKAA